MRLNAESAEEKKSLSGQPYGASAGGRRFRSATSIQRGFTLVELITIIVILGIMAVVAAPRFFEKNAFDSRGYYDQVISTLRFAQKTAIAQHTTVCVVDTATEIRLHAANCVTPLNVLVSQVCESEKEKTSYQYKRCAPEGVQITSAHGNLSFDALGSTPATKIYTVSGATQSITVEAETGYVH